MNSFRSDSTEEQRSKSLRSARYSIIDKIENRKRQSGKRNKSAKNQSISYTEKVLPLGTLIDI